MSDSVPVTIASAQLQADIQPLGAQLFALRDRQGRDLLWNGDPAVWKGRAPILFPIVGALKDNRYRLDGVEYHLPRHGFARDRLFEQVETDGRSVLFRLRWDAQTLAVYPFRFELDLRFTCEGAVLELAATIRNLESQVLLPASFGFHPALRWPLPYGSPRAAHAITFAREESAPVRRLDADGLLLPQSVPSPVTGNRLALRDDLFVNDALIFDSLASRSLRYGGPDGNWLAMGFDTPCLGVWSKPGAGFVAIEPWHGHADPQGFVGDFRDKPGSFAVAPGAEKRCAMTIGLGAA